MTGRLTRWGDSQQNSGLRPDEQTVSVALTAQQEDVVALRGSIQYFVADREMLVRFLEAVEN